MWKHWGEGIGKWWGWKDNGIRRGGIGKYCYSTETGRLGKGVVVKHGGVIEEMGWTHWGTVTGWVGEGVDVWKYWWCGCGGNKKVGVKDRLKA